VREATSIYDHPHLHPRNQIAMGNPERFSKLGLFFLRFIQLGSVTVTGFIYCYLVWLHNNHYCVYYPHQCTALQLSYVRVPWEYYLVITTCILAFLESFISTAFYLNRGQTPTYRSLLLTMSPVTVLFGLASLVIFKNPSTSGICWFFEVPTSLMSNVEERNCLMIVDGYVALSIAACFTGFLFLAAIIPVLSQYMRKRRIVLPSEPSPESVDVVDEKDLIKV
jgi:hypothetical protein